MVSMNSSAVPDRRVSRALWQGSGGVGQAQVDSGAPRPGHRPRACFNVPLLGVLAETQVLCIRYPLRRRGDCIDEDETEGQKATGLAQTFVGEPGRKLLKVREHALSQGAEMAR